MRLARIGDREGEFLPRARRIKRALIVPRAKQSKDLAPETTGEEPIHFIDPPEQAAFALGKDFAAQKPLEIHPAAPAAVPAFCCHINIHCPPYPFPKHLTPAFPRFPPPLH